MAVCRWAIQGFIFRGASSLRPLVLRHNSTLSQNTTGSDPERLDFGDTKNAYKSKRFSELLRQYVVFKALSFTFLVDNNNSIMKWCQKVFGDRLFTWAMKKTIYGQFVAGEDLDAIKPMIRRFKASGIHSILDYSVEADIEEEQEVVMELRQMDPAQAAMYSEPQTNPRFRPRAVKGVDSITKSSARTHFYRGEQQCKESVEHFLSCIIMAAEANKPNTQKDAFIAMKLTGLGRVDFLLRFSDVVTSNHNIFLRLAGSNDMNVCITPQSFHEGLKEVEIHLEEMESTRLFKQLDKDNRRKVNIHQFCNQFQPKTELHDLFKKKAAPAFSAKFLSEEDLAQMDIVVKQAKRLADCAQENGVRILVDAEQTYFQPAISHIIVNILMPQYNRDTPTIYNTIQCYLKSAEQDLRMQLALADMTGCLYCVKLVRGAYTEQERERAKDIGYPDPIWPNKQSTDDCYHRLLELLMKERTGTPSSPAHFMVASHNEATIKFVTEKMKEYNISRSDGVVVFGQLLGMCDHVTFPLGQAGYGAYKYMPYGPVKGVLPYLSRRANENRGFLEGAIRDRLLARKELIRRVTGW